MRKKFSKKPLAIAIGSAVVTSLSVLPAANAEQNPFTVNDLSSGYMQVSEGEATCGANMKKGEGSCGANKDGKKMEGKCAGEKKAEGKCGEGKCGEGKCGGKKAAPADAAPAADAPAE